MLKEFKEFITGGNVIEFAVAVIMAGAIGKVVTGFVSNIVMPVVGHVYWRNRVFLTKKSCFI